MTETTFTSDNQIDRRSIGALTDIIGKAESGDWQVKVDGDDAVVESDGTFIYEGLDLTPGQHTVTASGVNPFTEDTAADTITIIKLPETEKYYVYNALGDMLFEIPYWTNMTTYTWDLLNRLGGIELPDLTTHEYYYDGLGRRVKSIENGVERRFVYDGWNVIGERREGSDDFVSYYTRGVDVGGGIGGIISVHRNGTSEIYPNGYHEGDYFYHYNHRGDVVSVTDSSGAEVAHYRYDAFGNVKQKTGTFESSYQFSTKEYDAASGLIYYGYRYYSPELGVWLSKDPLGDVNGLNLYSYTTNNPVNGVDPLGLAVLPYASSNLPFLPPAAAAYAQTAMEPYSAAIAAAAGVAMYFASHPYEKPLPPAKWEKQYWDPDKPPNFSNIPPEIKAAIIAGLAAELVRNIAEPIENMLEELFKKDLQYNEYNQCK